LKKRKSNSKPKAKLKIGVTFDFNEKYGFFLKEDVALSITSREAELVPLVGDFQSIDRLLKTIDGLMIPGGLGDVDPALYRQKKKYDNVEIIRKRCDFEYSILQKYLPMNKPLLGICWGFQIVNVFLGGSLLQDIEQDKKTDVRHAQAEPKHLPTHWVHFDPRSKSRKHFGAEKLYVNSTHHQAIDCLADSLAPEGHCTDGILESYSMKKHPFCIGVQWHPERLADDPVIPSFLKACRR
jgi:putative glutamine amidotransferase